MLVYLVTVVCLGVSDCGTPPFAFDCMYSRTADVIGCGPAADDDDIESRAAAEPIAIGTALLYDRPLLMIPDGRIVVAGGVRCALVETTLRCEQWLRGN